METCVSTSRRTSASRASSAAWRAVECPVCRARSCSSSVKVASWTRTSASCEATRSISHGAVSPERTSLRPGRSGPTTCSGCTPLTTSPRCRRPKSGPNATPRRVASSASKRPGRRSGLGAEGPGRGLLDDRVAEGAAAVADVEGRHLVAVVGDRVAGLEVDDLERVAQAPVDDAHGAHERDGAGRAVDGQRRLAVAQLEGLEHPRQPQPVVGVVMGEEDGLHVGQADGAEQLALGPLAAVEEQAVAAATQERRRQPAASGRHGAGGTGEEEREVHARGSRVPPAPRVPAPTGPLDSFARMPRTPGIVKEFREFILRGNVVDLAVAVVIGAAFTAVVNALVKDLLTPVIAAIFGKPDFSNLAFTINDSRFAYGDFLNAVLTFVLVAAALFFFVVKPVNYLMERRRTGPDVESTTRDCPECLSAIPIAASRCAFCTTAVAPA